MNNRISPNSDTDQIIDIDKLGGRRSHRKRWLLLILLVAAIAITVAMRTRTAKSDSIQFKTEEVRRGDITVLVTATGTLEPTNEVEVGSELSGIVKSVEADYNDKVKVGQVLAKLDTSKLDAQVTQSKAALQAAEAKVMQAKATLNETRNKLDRFKKVRELSDNKVPSQTDFDAAQADFERAEADLASANASESQAKATLEAYQVDKRKSVICSPINGIVLTRNIEEGQTVAASFETPVLFTLAEDLTQMELCVDVDEADIGQVKDGQDATFTVDAYPNRTFQARIVQTRYGAQTVEGVVTYETVLEVDNTDLSLRPGMTATADIIVLKIENAVSVPNAALRFEMTQGNDKTDNGGLVSAILPHPPRRELKQKENAISSSNQQQVWAMRDGRPATVPVTTGVTDGVRTEILSGPIEPGMSLIVGTIESKRGRPR